MLPPPSPGGFFFAAAEVEAAEGLFFLAGVAAFAAAAFAFDACLAPAFFGAMIPLAQKKRHTPRHIKACGYRVVWTAC